MKNFFTISFLLFTFYSFSQKDSIKTKQLGVFYSPNRCSYIFDGGYGYVTGVNFSQQLFKRISYNTGVYYSSQADNVKGLYYGSNIDVKTGAIDTTFDRIDHYQFLEIPLIFDFYLIKSERINVFALVGATANFYLGNVRHNIKYPATGGKIIENTTYTYHSSLSKVVFSTSIGLGMEYKVNKDWNIILEPEYTIYAPSKSFNFGIGGYMSAAGINCGVTRNF